MTCLVGLETGGSVWLGTDSFMGGSSAQDLLDRPKWWSKHGIVCAYAGDPGNAALALRWSKLRAPKKREDPIEYLESVWYRAFLATKHREYTALIVMRGRLYGLDAAGIMRSAHGYQAGGSGAQVATGSLYSSAGLPPDVRIRLALDAAAAHTPTVSGPMHLQEIKG